jgi:hypothetical protein
LDNHNVELRVSKLFATITDMWNNNKKFQFNRVDREITGAMECAVNKCWCSQYSKYPWQEKFKEATYHIRYWRKLIGIAMQWRNLDDTTSFYKIQAGYTSENDHSMITEVECQLQIQMGVVIMK